MKQYDILQCTRMHPCDPILTAPSLNLYLSATVLILCAFDSFCASIASGFGPPAYFDERELIPIVARMTDVPEERQQELFNVLQTKYEQYDVAMGNWNEGKLKERPTPPPMGDKTANFLHAHPWIMKWIDRKDEPATVAWHFDDLPIGRFVTKASTAAWTNHDFTDGDGEGDYVSTKGVLGSQQAQTEWYKWVQTHEKQLLALMELPFDHNI